MGSQSRAWIPIARSRAWIFGFCICLAAVAQALAASPPIRIVCVGDSNFGAPGVARDQTFPAKLERALRAKGYNVVVANEGINGDTTAGVMGLLDTAVPNGTHIAIVSVGVNDVVHNKIPREAVRRKVEEIADRLRARGVAVVVLPSGKIFQGSAAENPDLHVEKYQNARNTQWHLNAAGYDIAVAEHLPKIEPVVVELSRKGDPIRKRK